MSVKFEATTDDTKRMHGSYLFVVGLEKTEAGVASDLVVETTLQSECEHCTDDNID